PVDPPGCVEILRPRVSNRLVVDARERLPIVSEDAHMRETLRDHAQPQLISRLERAAAIPKRDAPPPAHEHANARATAAAIEPSGSALDLRGGRSSPRCGPQHQD